MEKKILLAACALGFLAIIFITLKEKTIVFYLTLMGVFLFSGSIYILTTNSLTGIKSKLIGPITPIGGLLLILSWGYLFYAILTKK